MAKCIRCDRCGKIMDEVPFGEENARKTVKLEVITTFKTDMDDGKVHDILNNRKINKDLCSDCCWGLENAIFKYLEAKI